MEMILSKDINGQGIHGIGMISMLYMHVLRT